MSAGDDRAAHRSVRAPRDLAASVLLIVAAGFTLWVTLPLDFGTLRLPGPALFPRITAALMALCGVWLAVSAFASRGNPLDRWNVRGIFFLTVGILAFAMTIRTIGFMVAGPLAMILSGLASRETKWKESLVSAVILTVLCVVIFKSLLGLSFPVLMIPNIVSWR